MDKLGQSTWWFLLLMHQWESNCHTRASSWRLGVECPVINQSTYLQAKQERVKLTYILLSSVQRKAHSSLWQLTRKFRSGVSLSNSCHFILSYFFIQRRSSLHLQYQLFHVFEDRHSRVTKCAKVVHFTATASNCFVASARRQAETCASYCYGQQVRCLENGSGCNF
jgi:hypothetical protein